MSFAFEHFAVLLTNVISVAKKPTEHLFVLPPSIHFGQRANYQITQSSIFKVKKIEFKHRQITIMPKAKNVEKKIQNLYL